jgi:hypothetical protein
MRSPLAVAVWLTAAVASAAFLGSRRSDGGPIDIDELDNEAILITAIKGGAYLGDGGDLTDAPLDTVIEAVERDGNEHAVPHLFSIVSEDYRMGGASTHNAVDYYLRHQDLTSVTLTTISGPTDSQDATFRLYPALCEVGDPGCSKEKGCVSVMSANYQGYFLKYSQGEAPLQGEVSFEEGDGTAAMRVALTFCMEPGLGNSDTGISFKVPGNNSLYLMHTGYSLGVGKVDEDAAKNLATFRLRPGLFKGFCQGPDAPADCTCQPGYLGHMCTTQCPGLTIKDQMTTVCSNNGDCAEDADGKGVCNCHPSHLGPECSLECPKSELNNEVCHDRGTCERALPSSNQTGAVCKCQDGYLGKDCSKRCPGADADCSGHGKCALDKEGTTAVCTCDATHVGGDCLNECQKDKAGNICSGHGKCEDSDATSSSGTICMCKDGWVGRLCGRECPRAETGAVCGGPARGQCQERPGQAVCACKPGFHGEACSGNQTAVASDMEAIWSAPSTHVEVAELGEDVTMSTIDPDTPSL